MAKLTEKSSCSITFVCSLFYTWKEIYNCFSRLFLWACFVLLEQGFTSTWGADLKKVTKKERSDHISHISPPLFRPTLWHTRPITGWVANSWVSPLTNVANNARAVRVSRAEKDSISGLLLALSDLSKWLGWDIWLGKTRGKMFVKSGPGPIEHVVGYSFGQYSWLMRERWWFAQLLHFVGSDLFDMTLSGLTCIFPVLWELITLLWICVGWLVGS